MNSGMWTHFTKDVDESFESDRHFIDAETWFELQDIVRYQVNIHLILAHVVLHIQNVVVSIMMNLRFENKCDGLRTCYK